MNIGEIPCEHVITPLAAKLKDMRARLRELAFLDAELQHLMGRPTDSCEPTAHQ